MKEQRNRKDYYDIDSLETYIDAYRFSTSQPEKFWSQIAENNFIWHKKWDTVLDWDIASSSIQWFKNAELNITENCLDRHARSTPQKTAIIWEANDPAEDPIHMTYQELLSRVNKMANTLKAHGISKGDRVCIYLPMIPELAISLLACARIGAIHSVVFAGFSSTALSMRINDAQCSLIITSDGSYRGEKTINLKEIVDNALANSPSIKNALVVRRTNSEIHMKEGRDKWLEDELKSVSDVCPPEIMGAEDPLFILYTSGSTGKPKGMVHTTAGYMVYTSYTFKNIFNYREGDIYWCTADIGWITGHSYIIYGPLANGATTIIFEGVPSYPDYGRFWQIVERYSVNQFYTAPTAIRSLAKNSLDFVDKYNLSSLKTLGTVGEPINEEAWDWYNDHIGNQQCPIVDTWWQTETGGIMISAVSGVIQPKSTYASLPFIGIQPCLVDLDGNEIKGNPAEGRLCIKYPWPGIARTVYGNHQRYKETYFSTYKDKYFTGDGALRDHSGYYRITGRVDDVVIVSGHNLGTAPIEDVINAHPYVAESAIVGFPHEIKGNALYGFIILKNHEGSEEIKTSINALISQKIGSISKLSKILFVDDLPKTRSGKIMRRILRKIASGEKNNLGDTSTLLNPECVKRIIVKA